VHNIDHEAQHREQPDDRSDAPHQHAGCLIVPVDALFRGRHHFADQVERVRREIHPAQRAVAPDAAMIHQAVALIHILPAQDRGPVSDWLAVHHDRAGNRRHFRFRKLSADQQKGHADKK